MPDPIADAIVILRADMDELRARETDRPGLAVYNVKGYGAYGDGATDDTTAIQLAIDTCLAAGGGSVYFPAGTYELTTAPLIRPVTNGTNINIALVGASRQSVVLHQNTAAAHTLSLYDSRGDGANRGVNISHMTFTGETTTGNGIYIKNIHEVIVDDVGVHDVGGVGIYAETAYVARFRDCIIKDCVSNGITVGTVSHWTMIDHCEMKLNGGWGLMAQTSNGLSIVNCDLEANNSGDMQILGCGGVDISGNYFETVAGGIGIQLENDAHGVSIHGNYAQGYSINGLYFIEVGTADGVEISGNRAATFDYFVRVKAAPRDVHVGRNSSTCTTYTLMQNNFTRMDYCPDSGQAFDIIPFSTGYRRRHYLESSTTTGVADLVGDTIINLTPAAAGASEYRCTGAGSPGTWKAVNCVA